jgi:hypothetical protein
LLVDAVSSIPRAANRRSGAVAKIRSGRVKA